ncbi:MAG: tail fiber domain-containing protein [Ferruginibacter sp.]
MKTKIFLLIIACGFQQIIYGQNIGINSTGATPDNSAMLDVSATNKGFLMPRMSSAQRTAIATPAIGLQVYDTDNNSYWFYNGTAWSQLTTGSNAWSLTGNAGTIPAAQFIGTTDNQPLLFRVNNLRAGEIHPTSGNSFFGLEAGQANTTGIDNTANGYQSLFSNIRGQLNTAIGYRSLYSNTTGNYNTATGYQSLFSNITGIHNTASGLAALYLNTTGSENTANGFNSLFSNTTGDNNTAIGDLSLQSNTTGNNNTATGFRALFNNDNGPDNTANGSKSLYSNTTGSGNTASGVSALYNNTSAVNNSASGDAALYSNTLGNYNTASGAAALYYLVGGSKNIAIGYFSGTAPGSPNVNNTISIGNDDILNGASNQVIIGNFSSTGYYSHNSWSTFSDARIKTNIKQEVKGLDFIMRLKPVTYNKSIKEMVRLTGNKETADFPGKYDVEKITYSGFLAQDVEQAAKETGYDFSGLRKPKTDNDLYALSYETFVVPLVKAMQEQQVIITDQQRQIELFEKRLIALEQKSK